MTYCSPASVVNSSPSSVLLSWYRKGMHEDYLLARLLVAINRRFQARLIGGHLLDDAVPIEFRRGSCHQ